MTPEEREYNSVTLISPKKFEDQNDAADELFPIQEEEREAIQRSQNMDLELENLETGSPTINSPKRDKAELASLLQKATVSIGIVTKVVGHKTHHADGKLVFSKEQWKNIYENIPEGKFVDAEFPPAISSVIGYGIDSKKKPVDPVAKSIWQMRRQYKFLPGKEIMKDLQVVVDGIDPSDIFQGALGDCYYLSAISAVAEYGHRIGRILIETQPNEKEVFGIALCICGIWKMIILDDYFTIRKSKITFCHSQDAEIWAMLLEKAYAKAYRGYWNIGTGGFAEDALKDLTGAPAEYIPIRENGDLEELWKILEKADREENIMVIGSRGEGEQTNEQGIVSGHAYTLIGVHTLHNERVLEIRNPWGKGDEWNGRWNDDDLLWTEELRNELNAHSAEDGRFFMPLEDFPSQFEQLAICYYNDNYIYSSRGGDVEPNKIVIFKFEVTEAGQYYICMSQPDERGFREEDSKYFFKKVINILLLMFCLFKKTGAKFCIKEVFKMRREIFGSKTISCPGLTTPF